MRISYRGRRGVFPLILLLMILGVPLYAGGGADSTDNYDPKAELENAAALIEEGHLDDAIQALVEIARRDPEQMERVQKIILSIREREKKIYEIFDDIKILVPRDDLDPDEKLRLLEDLFNKVKILDSDPTSDTWKNLSYIESGLLQSLDILRREDFFIRGNEKLALLQYKEAVDEYQSGFLNSVFGESQTYEKYRNAGSPEDIEKYLVNPERQKVIFDAYKKNAPQGDIIIEDMESLLNLWKQNSLLLNDLETSAVNAVIVLNPESWDDALAEYLGALKTIADEIQGSIILSENLTNLKLKLYEDLGGTPEEFRYDRIGLLFSGREGMEPEGILFAQESQWENAYLSLFSGMLERVRRPYTDGQVQFNSGLLNDALVSYSLTGAAAEKTLEIIQGAETYSATQLESGITRFTDLLDPVVTEIRITLKASDLRGQLIEISRKQPKTDDASLAALNLEEIQNLSEELQISIDQYEALLSDWTDTMSLYAEYPGVNTPAVEKIDADLKNDLNSLLENLYALRVNVFILYMEPRYNTLDIQVSETLGNVQSSMSEAQSLIDDGRPTAAQTLEIAPSLSALNSLSTAVSDFLDTVDDVLAGSTAVEDSLKFLGFQTKAETLLVNLSTAISGWQGIKTDAATRRNTALRSETIAMAALDEAETLIASAREADLNGRRTNNINESYRAKDLYTSASAALGRAKVLLAEVELNDKDVAGESGIQERLSVLEAETLSAPRNLAVTVRDYAISEADTAFVERRYGEGLSVLLQAQEFWVSIFGEEDTRLRERIVRFRVVQQSAQDTVINASDPLYMEMNQYLNLANRYYNEGLRLSPSGSTIVRNPDALRAFTAAGDLLQQVLNVFPGNASALLLKMKILQATDPDKYSRTVRSLIAESETALRRNDREIIEGTDFKQGLDPQLQAVYSFNPDFPSLSDLIYRIDVYMGRVVPEPSQADINNSRRLTQAVKDDWEQTKVLGVNVVTAASPGLIRRLDDAIVLWEDNIEAANLQDAIRFYTAPQPTPAELRLLIDRAEETMLQNSVSTVQIIYDAIIDNYSGFRNHPDVLKIKTWLDNRK